MSNEKLHSEVKEEKQIVNTSLQLRSTLRSLFKDHCFNEALPIQLRNELYRLSDLAIPVEIDEKKKWNRTIKRFIVRLKAKVRSIKKKKSKVTRATVR
jgi:hypothetical protein